MEKEAAVLDFIDKNFEPGQFEIIECNLFPFARRVIGKNKSEILVYWDIWSEEVKYTFTDKDKRENIAAATKTKSDD